MVIKREQGFFITLEGIEGAGKSTHAIFIKELLEQKGRECLVTREPGGTALGEKVREILLQKNELSIGPLSELLLMFAARAQHIEEVIVPALEEGRVVICDRFSDSSYAYQGGGRGVDMASIDTLAGIVHPDLAPDLTLLFDVTPETGLGRARSEKAADRFESERVSFFHASRRVYLDRAAAEPERFRVIDAERDIDAIQAEIRSILGEW